jgi:hypothetical protein
MLKLMMWMMNRVITTICAALGFLLITGAVSSVCARAEGRGVEGGGAD